MKIEWASSFRSDGTRCKPPPSTMHGWLAKMRGTLLGDEDLRSKGMKEMRDARAYKAARRKRQQARTGQGLMSFFTVGSSRRTHPARQLTRGSRGSTSTKPRQLTRNHQSSHQSRPSYKTSRSSNTTQRPTRITQPRPRPRPSGRRSGGHK